MRDEFEAQANRYKEKKEGDTTTIMGRRKGNKKDFVDLFGINADPSEIEGAAREDEEERDLD